MSSGWEIFPVEGTAAQKLRFLIQYAVLAPSEHNAQPWRFRVEEDSLALYADRTRGLPVSDPYDRELTIGCGAALMNLRVAARRFAYDTELELFPDGVEEDLLARVRLAGRRDPAGMDRLLFDSIPRRRTYRRRFGDRTVDGGTIAALQGAASLEGAWLELISGEERRRDVARLVADADALLWSNPSWRRELAAWMHPRRRGDGLRLAGVPATAAHLLVRTFDLGAGQVARDLQIAEGSPCLFALGTKRDEPLSWLAAGQALEAVLLRANVEGLQASFLNQPMKAGPLRGRMRELVGHPGEPHLLLRMGYPTEELEPTPRRPLDDVID